MRVGSSSRLPLSHVPLVEPRSFSVQTPPACTSIMQWNAETPVPSRTIVLLASRPIVTCVPGNGCVRVVPSGAVTRRLNMRRASEDPRGDQQRSLVLGEVRLRLDRPLHAVLRVVGERSPVRRRDLLDLGTTVLPEVDRD